jgi:O-antigen/teichoic acid export membrane protein
MSRGREIAKNVVSLLAGGLVGKVCRFLGIVVVANRLGAETFGALSAVFGVIYVLAIAADLGLSHLATRELAADPDRRADMVVNVLSLKAILLVIACGLVVLASRLLPLSRDIALLVAVSAVLIATHEVVFEWLFEGSGRVELSGLYRVLLNGVFLAGALVLVKGPGSILLVPLIDAGSSIFGVIVCLLVWPGVWRYARGKVDLRSWPGLLRCAATFGVANALNLAVPYVGVFVLIALAGPGDAGVFRAAGAVVFGLLSVGYLIGRAVYPVLSRIARTSPKSAGQVLAPVLRLAFAMSLPAAVGITMLSGAFTALLYETEYAPAATVLTVLVWSLPMALVTVTLHYALLAYAKEKHRVAGLALHLAIEIGLGVPLVLKFGYVGAAAAHLAGQLMSLTYACWQFRRVERVTVLRHALRPALACLALVGTVYLFRSSHLAVPVAAGAAAYAVALFVVGGIRPREIVSMVRLIVSSGE